MRMVVAGFALAAACGLGTAASAASKLNDVTCTSFMRDYPQNLSGFRVSFERPLTITRDLLGDENGIEVHILSTDVDVEGTLKCKGDAFRRFEVRVDADASETVLSNYAQFEEAALLSSFHWDKAKAGTVVSAMSADAKEYLRASIERGDTYNAGKVEY